MSEREDQGGQPSKSARKRELLALQALAERMVELGDGQLRSLGVDERLLAALGQLRAMRPSGARNRQLKYCVKFMDRDALAQVQAYLEDRRSQQVASNQALHQVEQWRDRLLAEGDAALGTFLAENPTIDRQHLRRLCRDAARERDSGRPAGAARRLFRYLREAMATQ
jgi:ribosome-associated protein